MKQVKIYKDNKILAKTDIGMSDDELNVWLSKHIAKNTFGLPERPETDAEGNGTMLPAEYQVEIVDISAQVEQEKINAEALAFLASTDWMVIRAMEKGLEISPELKAERQAARDRIVR